MGRRRPASFTRLDRALRRAWALGVQRRSLPWPPWRQLSLVVTGIIVAVAMVTIAELARENGDRHRRAQVVVESIQASSEQLDAITAQALADSLASHARGPRLSITLLAGAIGAWKGITGALVQLSSLESDSRTARLHRDAQALFDVGVKTLDSVKGIPPSAALRIEQHEFSPALARLGLDAGSASTYERGAADAALASAQKAFVGSLALGLLALLLIGARVHRLRRKAALEIERRAIETRSEARLRALVEHSTDVVTVMDADLVVRWQAASVRRVLGYDAETMIGQPLTTLVHPDDMALVERMLTMSVGRPGSHMVSARFSHGSGGWRTVEALVDDRIDDPAVGGLVLSMRDVTERKALEDELRHQAFHDSLTGLANRALFEDRLAHAVAIAERRQRVFAVVFFDLDDFKTINDSLGHARGDDLLRAAANRILGILRGLGHRGAPGR